MSQKIINRIFIVGCPRSGTTLLQSLIAAHSNIESFPETHFFKYTVYLKYPFFNKLGIASLSLRKRINDFLDEINQPNFKNNFSKFDLSIKSCTKRFICILDQLTLNKQKNNWVEKTPEHLRYIDSINKYVPSPKFIHIIRNGKDVIASLYEVTNKYSREWGGKRNLDECIQLWINDIKISKSYLDTPNHFFIRYEDLVSETNKVLKIIFIFLGIEFNENVLNNYSRISDKIILSNEIWKASTTSIIENMNNFKFDTIFNKEQKNYISSKISNINLDNFIIL